jgi:hypothetical protein
MTRVVYSKAFTVQLLHEGEIKKVFCVLKLSAIKVFTVIAPWNILAKGIDEQKTRHMNHTKSITTLL